jgi:hypothetical protein
METTEIELEVGHTQEEQGPRYVVGQYQEHIVAKNAFVGVGADEGVVEVGNEGIAVCGWLGKAITGERGAVVVETGGIGQGDWGSTLIFLYPESNEYVGCKVGYVRPNQLLPNTPYTLDLNHEIVPHFSSYS